MRRTTGCCSSAGTGVTGTMVAWIMGDGLLLTGLRGSLADARRRPARDAGSGRAGAWGLPCRSVERLRLRGPPAVDSKRRIRACGAPTGAAAVSPRGVVTPARRRRPGVRGLRRSCRGPWRFLQGATPAGAPARHAGIRSRPSQHGLGDLDEAGERWRRRRSSRAVPALAVLQAGGVGCRA